MSFISGRARVAQDAAVAERARPELRAAPETSRTTLPSASTLAVSAQMFWLGVFTVLKRTSPPLVVFSTSSSL